MISREAGRRPQSRAGSVRLIPITTLVVLLVTAAVAAGLWLRSRGGDGRQVEPGTKLAAPEPSAAQSPAAESTLDQTQVAAAREPPHEHTNHLIDETSPYLLQHAHNPVNWYPWGPEALAKAREEDKPIFLSVGYSTCYWCHVMELESFADEEVAAVLNDNFIAIKVDREERPDVDEQYMLATELMTGSGGWPNSLWLTPDGRPWMAGTYYPKEQFLQVLKSAALVWRVRRGQLEQQADQVAAAVRQLARGAAARTEGDERGLLPALIDHAVSRYQQQFDSEWGGFTRSPKFPPHGILSVLAHAYGQAEDPELLGMLTRTLDAMWLGGIHDHVGGGFHRYSTDRVWRVPHFEKMLYDNAQLMRAYTDGYLKSGEPRYRRAVEDIFTWIERDMTSPEGGFYSAIDAGEVDEEGKAYLWRLDEIIDVLGETDGTLFQEVYNVTEEGNYVDEIARRRTGANILHLQEPLEAIAARRGQDAGPFQEDMAALRAKLLAARRQRPRPHKDDKILTGWNGLAIGSLAYAGRSVDEPRYTEAAVRAAEFLLANAADEQGRLLRSFRAGEARQPAYLDDYAYFIQGLLELHAATGDQRWLAEAQRLADVMREDFEDDLAGGFFLTSERHDDLLMRSKNLLGSGNVPSANGVAVLVLLELHRLTGQDEYEQSARRALESVAWLLWDSPESIEAGVLAAAVYVQRRGSQGPAADLQPAERDPVR